MVQSTKTLHIGKTKVEAFNKLVLICKIFLTFAAVGNLPIENVPLKQFHFFFN